MLASPVCADAEIGLAALEDVARVIDRDAEVQALLPAIARGQHADHPAVAIQHRTAGVAGVGGRVRLHQRDAAAVAKAADDAARDAVLQRPERRADDDDFLARLQARRRAHLQERLRRRRLRDLEHRDVEVGRARLDARRHARAVHSPQRHVAVLLHDVHVGDQRVVPHEERAAASAGGFHQDDRRHGTIDHVFERRGAAPGPTAATALRS